eukprot:Skav217907  [mRNA]  locus=scaffold795:178256:178831:- [translate_table: standard]
MVGVEYAVVAFLKQGPSGKETEGSGTGRLYGAETILHQGLSADLKGTHLKTGRAPVAAWAPHGRRMDPHCSMVVTCFQLQPPGAHVQLAPTFDLYTLAGLEDSIRTVKENSILRADFQPRSEGCDICKAGHLDTKPGIWRLKDFCIFGSLLALQRCQHLNLFWAKEIAVARDRSAERASFGELLASALALA